MCWENVDLCLPVTSGPLANGAQSCAYSSALCGAPGFVASSAPFLGHRPKTSCFPRHEDHWGLCSGRGRSQFCLMRPLGDLSWALALTSWIRMLLDCSVALLGPMGQSSGVPAGQGLGLGSPVQYSFPKPGRRAVCTHKFMPMPTYGRDPGSSPTADTDTVARGPLADSVGRAGNS